MQIYLQLNHAKTGLREPLKAAALIKQKQKLQVQKLKSQFTISIRTHK